MSSVVIQSIDEGEIRRLVNANAEHLIASRPDMEEIVIFGSFESRNWSPGNDVDVFIVLGRSDQPVWDRVSSLIPPRFPVGVDLFPYTRAEMAQLAPSPLLDAVARSTWRYRRG